MSHVLVFNSQPIDETGTGVNVDVEEALDELDGALAANADDFGRVPGLCVVQPEWRG